MAGLRIAGLTVSFPDEHLDAVRAAIKEAATSGSYRWVRLADVLPEVGDDPEELIWIEFLLGPSIPVMLSTKRDGEVSAAEAVAFPEY